MAQRDPINQESDLEDKLAYLGKTTAVLHYCLAAGFGFAAVTLAWLAIRAHYQGVSTSIVTPLDQTIFLGALSAYCLLFAITFFLMPSLQSQFPKLRHENRFSHENMELQHKKSARYSRKHRKITVQHAPKSIRGAIHFCYWTPVFLFVVLIGSTLISQSPLSPNWLNQFHSSFNTMFSGSRIGFLFLGFMMLFKFPQELLERHARHLYDRHLRRLELHPNSCPDCDYPIDPDNPLSVCSECGFVRSDHASALKN